MTCAFRSQNTFISTLLPCNQLPIFLSTTYNWKRDHSLTWPSYPIHFRKSQKDEKLKADARTTRHVEKLKASYEKEMELEKRQECERTFQEFLRKKGTGKRPPASPTLTQRWVTFYLVDKWIWVENSASLSTPNAFFMTGLGVREGLPEVRTWYRRRFNQW